MSCVHCGILLGVEDLEMVCLPCVEAGLPIVTEEVEEVE